MFKFDMDDLKEVQSELNELIEKIEIINSNSEIIGQKMIDSGVPEEYIVKIFDIIMKEIYE